MRYLLAVVVLVPAMAQAVNGNFFPNGKQLRSKYQYLYKLAVKDEGDGSKSFHNARLFNRQGINILFLKGDPFEMAFQHGKLLSKEVRSGAVIAASRMVSNSIRATFGHKPLIESIAKKVIDRDYTTKFLDNAIRRYPSFSRAVLDRVFAVSEASGLAKETLLDAALNPSVIMMLANRDERMDSVRLGIPPANGCTTFAAWDDYTPDGSLLIGRNTDYPLGGYFERGSTVIYFEPTDGRQRFMSIITAGVHTASVTAINESGVYLGTHSLPTTHTGTTGMPMIMWMHDAIGLAKTVDDAVKILSTRKTGVGWTYVVASGKEKRVLSIEIDNSGAAVRESRSGKHVQTNHYLTSKLKTHTLYFNRGTYEETHNRYKRTNTLVEDFKGQIDPLKAIRILGDHDDVFSSTKNGGFPSNVGATTTVSSIVVNFKDSELHVATGTAPVPHNPYIRLPFPGKVEAPSFGALKIETMSDPWFQKAYPNRFKAIKKYIDAKMLFEYANDAQKAWVPLAEAAALVPEVGHYNLMKGLIEIRMGNFNAAIKTLEETLKRRLSPHGLGLTRYYLARLYANAKCPSCARTHLAPLTSSNATDRALKEAANDLNAKLKRKRRVRLAWFDVIPMFQFGDLQKY